MKKFISLLKKVELFEKLATYGNRTMFLESLSQVSEVDPNDPSQEKLYSGEYDSSKNPEPTLYMPEEHVSAKPPVAPQKQLSSKPLVAAVNVMNKYMSDPEYGKKSDLQNGVDKLWSGLAASYGLPAGSGKSGVLGSLTAVNDAIKYLETVKLTDPNASAETKDFDRKKLDLLKLRKKDISMRMGVPS